MYFRGFCLILLFTFNSVAFVDNDSTVDVAVKDAVKNASEDILHSVKQCNATVQCANGGKCLQKVCSCLKGTSGDLCQTIDECKGWGKCGTADCFYNVSSQEPYCKCRGSLAFDDNSKTCKECDCGRYGRSCTFVRGKKVCDCMTPYEDRKGICTSCFCKGYAVSMYGCKFDDDGNMKCPCWKGYAQIGNECEECDCGDHGKCSFGSSGEKICTCDEGYIDDKGTCKECDCGKNGRCSIDYNGKKKCSCYVGYKEYQGTCKGCNCVYDAACEFDKNGNPKCVCRSGYGMKNGVCTPCDCYPGTSCSFAGSSNYMEKKVCDCPKGYADDSGRCRVCDCEAPGSNCTFSFSFMKCQCPEGYTEEEKPYSFFKKFCKDIDECQNSYVCPLSTTKCVNTPGSYKCVCIEGYEGPDSSDDIKRNGCTDINECVRYYKPCNDEEATCVNTIGSYMCECPSGYLSRDSEEKWNVCGSGSRPWRIATIIIGLASATIIIGLLIAIFQKCSS